MSNLTIRNLDETVKANLRLRAAQHQCSMEEEARRILKQALQNIEAGLATRIHTRFSDVGGIELGIPERSAVRKPPSFAEGKDAL